MSNAVIRDINGTGKTHNNISNVLDVCGEKRRASMGMSTRKREQSHVLRVLSRPTEELG